MNTNLSKEAKVKIYAIQLSCLANGHSKTPLLIYVDNSIIQKERACQGFYENNLTIWLGSRISLSRLLVKTLIWLVDWINKRERRDEADD